MRLAFDLNDYPVKDGKPDGAYDETRGLVGADGTYYPFVFGESAVVTFTSLLS